MRWCYQGSLCLQWLLAADAVFSNMQSFADLLGNMLAAGPTFVAHWHKCSDVHIRYSAAWQSWELTLLSQPVLYSFQVQASLLPRQRPLLTAVRVKS